MSIRIKYEMLALGVGLFLWGVIVIVKKGYYSSLYSRYIDWGELHVVIGLVMVVGGAYCIYNSFKNETKKDKEE